MRAADGAGIVAQQPLAPQLNDSEDDDEARTSAAPGRSRRRMDPFGHRPALVDAVWISAKAVGRRRR